MAGKTAALLFDCDGVIVETEELHRLAYLVALLVLQHMLLGPFASRLWTLVIFGAVGLYGLLRLLPRRGAPSAGAEEEPLAALDAEFVLLTGTLTSLLERLQKTLGGFAQAETV